MTLRALALALLTAATLAGCLGPAGAQGRGGGGIPGQFDFYVLALSWSPGFCDGEGARNRQSRQCDAGRRLGFVVHGLWPQYERGFPSECGADRTLPRAALDEANGLFPDEGLARYEWRRHGTCSGLGPVDYMRAVREARAKVAIPEPLAGLARDGETTATALERAFADSNPGLRADMISVQCPRGSLSEVRICLSRDLRSFRTCPEVNRRSCRGAMRVSAPR